MGFTGTSSSSTLLPWQLVITAPVIFQAELSLLFSTPTIISTCFIEMEKKEKKNFLEFFSDTMNNDHDIFLIKKIERSSILSMRYYQRATIVLKE